MEYHGMLNNRLLSAMRKRDIETVLKLLLIPILDINYSSKKKITPLILASKLGLLSVCEKLLALRVDLSCSDLDGQTALHHSCCNGHTSIVKLLIAACSNIHTVNQESDQAITSGSVETVEALVNAGSDVNRPNHTAGSTPLDLTVLHDRADIVDLLLQSGANVHRRSIAKETALHFAVQVGSTDIVKLLLSASANINYVLTCETKLHSSSYPKY